MRVGLFVTCFIDTVAPEVGRATVHLLERLGHVVAFPAAQACCGQLHINSGFRPEAVPMLDGFARAFQDVDVIVSPSPSCVASLRGEAGLVVGEAVSTGGDAGLPDRLADTVAKVYELTEFLVDVLGVTDVGATFRGRVAFHATCHSTRFLGISDRPTRLLAAVADLELVHPEGSDVCCGFGGTFAVKNADTSLAMGSDKLRSLTATGASVITAADTSCLLHLGGMLSRMHSSVRVLHLAEILAAGGGPA